MSKMSKEGSGIEQWHGSPDRRSTKTKCVECGAPARFDVDRLGQTVRVCESDACGHIERLERRVA